MGIGLAGRLGVLVAGALAVSGCGGSSTGGGPSYVEMLDRFENLTERALARNPTIDMPVAGTAQYFGRGGFLIGDSSDEIEESVLGRVAMTADFGRSRVDGRITDLRDFGNNRVPGTLNVRSGTIVDNTVPDLAVRGTVTLQGARTDLDMAGVGGFTGQRAQYFVGVYDGTAVSESESRRAFGVFTVFAPQE